MQSAGVRINGIDNRIENNDIALNPIGLEVLEGGNLIRDNFVLFNGEGPEDDRKIAEENILE